MVPVVLVYLVVPFILAIVSTSCVFVQYLKLIGIYTIKSIEISFSNNYTSAIVDEIQKMLQAIINSQSAFRQEILKRFDKTDKKIENLQIETRQGKKELTERIDKLGKQLAYLEDDAPTKEEFDSLENRVNKLEKHSTTSIS